MSDRVVIIPAAGKAVRFGGILKELLPITDTETSLRRTVENALIGMDADEVRIITSIDKIHDHIRHINELYPLANISYRMQTIGLDLWGAILTGISNNKPGGLLLADTVTYIQPDMEITAPLVFGTFETRQPERFSVLYDNTIITKKHLEDNQSYKAWGCIMWDAQVAQFLSQLDVDHYDDAFRDAIALFGYATFDLPYYYDLGNFKAYKEYLLDR